MWLVRLDRWFIVLLKTAGVTWAVGALTQLGLILYHLISEGALGFNTQVAELLVRAVLNPLQFSFLFALPVGFFFLCHLKPACSRWANLAFLIPWFGILGLYITAMRGSDSAEAVAGIHGVGFILIPCGQAAYGALRYFMHHLPGEIPSELPGR